MDPRSLAVVHLVTADTPVDRIDTLRALLAAPGRAAAQCVLHLGPGRAHRRDHAHWFRLYAPPLPWLRARALRHDLRRRGLLDGGRPVIVHAWSSGAAAWYVPLAATHQPLLLEVGTAVDLQQVARWSSTACLGLVCPTATVQRRLRALGVPAARCTQIYPGIASAIVAPAERAAIRERLELEERDLVVSALPPATRQTGTFIATWATLLLEKVRTDVRLVIPADGRERDRVWRLVSACRHERVVRCTPPDLPLSDLLAASDLAAYLPTGDAPLNALGLAMAAGCPLVATDTPAVTEVLGHGRNVWLCRPGDPADAARVMLRAVDDPEQSARQAQSARTTAETLFAPARMLARYWQAYANLAARRPVGADD